LAVLCLACVLASRPARAEVPHALKVCGDAAEWAPFTYFERNGTAKTDVPTGFSVDYLTELLALSGRVARIEFLPWQRCVAVGTTGGFDILLDGVDTAERERDFAFPQELYTVREAYFFLSARPVPPLATADEFNRQRICGVRGYNYPAVGILDSSVVARAPTLEDGIKLLESGHCEVLPTPYEAVAGLRLTGGPDLLGDPRFGWRLLPGMSYVRFHFIVSRAVPYRDELVETINKGIDAMKQSGTDQRLREQYLPP
jgi:polar amino acid transport system substrate-binding protein